jgi:hypothetical protein
VSIRVRSWFPGKRWVEPQAPIAAVPVARLVNDKLQRFHTCNVNFVAGSSCSANDRGTKDLFAIGFNDENDPGGVGLMSRVQAGFAAQYLPLTTQIEDIAGW